MFRKLILIVLLLATSAAAEEPTLTLRQEGLELIVPLNNPGPQELIYETFRFGENGAQDINFLVVDQKLRRHGFLGFDPPGPREFLAVPPTLNAR